MRLGVEGTQTLYTRTKWFYESAAEGPTQPLKNLRVSEATKLLEAALFSTTGQPGQQS